MFTKQQIEVLNGLMLGDGCLTGKCNKHLTIDRQLKDHNYTLYIADIFKDRLCEKSIFMRNRFDKRTNKTYQSSCFYTACSADFTEFYKKWYPEGHKIVPKDLTLTSTTIAIWLADDGCFRIRNNHFHSISIATNGFIKQDVEFLTRLLQLKYNIPFYTYETSPNQYEIKTFKQQDIKNIINDIDEYFPSGIERKSDLWRKNENIWELVNKEKLVCPQCNNNNTFREGVRLPSIRIYCNDCKRRFSIRLKNQDQII